MEYFFAIGNEQRGPVSLEQLAGFGLRPDTLVWREGLAEWVRADALPELASLVPVAQIAVPIAPLPPVVPMPMPPVLPATVGYESATSVPPNNGFAIVSVVLGAASIPLLCVRGAGVLCAIGAIVTGFIALSQIRRTGANGRGMARAGIILGFACFALIIAFVIFAIILAAQMFPRSAPL